MYRKATACDFRISGKQGKLPISPVLMGYLGHEACFLGGFTESQLRRLLESG